MRRVRREISAATGAYGTWISKAACGFSASVPKSGTTTWICLPCVWSTGLVGLLGVVTTVCPASASTTAGGRR